MSSLYPNAIDGKDQIAVTVDRVTPIDAKLLNDIRSAIINIENELGTVPSRDYPNVKLRIDALEDIIENLNPIDITGLEARIAQLEADVINLASVDVNLQNQIDVIIGLPDPISIDAAVIVEDGVGNYEQRRLRQADIDPDFEISSFSLNSGGLIEVGNTFVNPAFTASYSLPADSATIEDNDGNPATTLSDPYTSFNHNYSYTKNTYGASVQFTLEAGELGVTDTAVDTKTWAQKVFWGVGADGGNSESFIEALSNNALTTTKNRTFTVTAGVTDHIYYAYRAAFSDATFTVGGFAGGFELVSSSISVTNAYGFTENYKLYKSTNPNLGNTTVVVT